MYKVVLPVVSLRESFSSACIIPSMHVFLVRNDLRLVTSSATEETLVTKVVQISLITSDSKRLLGN